MIEVKVNKEIREIKGKIWMGFSVREIVTIAAVIAVMVLLNFILPIPNSIAADIGAVICTPILFIGFFRPYGLPAEKMLLRMLESQMMCGKKLEFNSNVGKEKQHDVYKADRKKRNGKRKNTQKRTGYGTLPKHVSKRYRKDR